MSDHNCIINTAVQPHQVVPIILTATVVVLPLGGILPISVPTKVTNAHCSIREVHCVRQVSVAVAVAREALHGNPKVLLSHTKTTRGCGCGNGYLV